jgi:hypothetical protein
LVGEVYRLLVKRISMTPKTYFGNRLTEQPEEPHIHPWLQTGSVFDGRYVHLVGVAGIGD